MKKNNKLFISIIIFIIGIIIGVFFQPLVSGDNIFKELKKFDYVLNTAYKNYVDVVDSHKLVESAIKGMLEELDPHSIYITAEEMKSVTEDFEGAFEGIGIEFDVIHDTITVISPIPGGPSELLGILAGDKIIKIDGVNAVGLDRNEVPKKLRGPKGTTVTVEIKRNGIKKLLTYVIVRDKIPLYTVDASFIIDNTDIGVIVINRFAMTTYDEFIKAIEKLESKGMKKLILDLRGNPGGFLGQAFYIADEFFKKGDTIVYTKGRLPESNEAFVSTDASMCRNLPVIVLINAGSASASEILAGAIQDLDRGLIVGNTSFGKGLVQKQFEIPDGSAFRITTSRYYTPSGRCIQRSYENKSDYHNLYGRIELEDGNYIYNSIERIKSHLEKNNPGIEKINIDSLPIYYSKKGRIVLGGGGIIPDVIVSLDTLTDFGVEIKMKIRYNEFINDYIDVKSIKNKYYDNFDKFLKEFTINSNILNDFKKYAENKGIKWNEEQFTKDKEFILNSLKAYIANSIWGRNEMIQIFAKTDKQLNTAISLFPEAIKLFSSK